MIGMQPFVMHSSSYQEDNELATIPKNDGLLVELYYRCQHYRQSFFDWLDQHRPLTNRDLWIPQKTCCALRFRPAMLAVHPQDCASRPKLLPLATVFRDPLTGYEDF
jgi:hypothetical protein